MAGEDPVSYTHLDVYKRQKHRSATQNYWPFVIGVVTEVTALTPVELIAFQRPGRRTGMTPVTAEGFNS